MRKFEYRVIEIGYHEERDRCPSDWMNTLGQEGWELVQIVRYPETSHDEWHKTRCFFKREIAQAV